MSQYAYIPASNIGQVSLNYMIGPSTWTFQKDGIEYGGFEEIIFSSAQKNEIISLGGAWFENAQAIQTWMIGTNPAELKRKDINFGNSLLLEFLTGQKDITLDNATYRAMSETFKYAEAALRRGDIPQAKTELTNIAPSDPVWTQSAKDYFLNKINTYLGI